MALDKIKRFASSAYFHAFLLGFLVVPFLAFWNDILLILGLHTALGPLIFYKIYAKARRLVITPELQLYGALSYYTGTVSLILLICWLATN